MYYAVDPFYLQTK